MCPRDDKQPESETTSSRDNTSENVSVTSNGQRKIKETPKKTKTRWVPPFSYQSLQKNTRVYPPPRHDIFKQQVPDKTDFQKYFLSGLLPISTKTAAKAAPEKRSDEPTDKKKRKINWTVPPHLLDYSYYLPIFFEGLVETSEPYKSMAKNGLFELITAGRDKILPVVPQLIKPIKKALNTKNPEIMVETLKSIQLMVKEGECVGEALVPYYRQILQICNLFREHTVSTYDEIDTLRNTRMGDVIQDTLEILERYGGRHAYVNIKYMIPTYESAVMNC